MRVLENLTFTTFLSLINGIISFSNDIRIWLDKYNVRRCDVLVQDKRFDLNLFALDRIFL